MVTSAHIHTYTCSSNSIFSEDLSRPSCQNLWYSTLGNIWKEKRHNKYLQSWFLTALLRKSCFFGTFTPFSFCENKSIWKFNILFIKNASLFKVWKLFLSNGNYSLIKKWDKALWKFLMNKFAFIMRHREKIIIFHFFSSN